MAPKNTGKKGTLLDSRLHKLQDYADGLYDSGNGWKRDNKKPFYLDAYNEKDRANIGATITMLINMINSELLIK